MLADEPQSEAINYRLAVPLGLVVGLCVTLMIASIALLYGVNRQQAHYYSQRQRLESSALRLTLALEQESRSVNDYLTQANEEHLDTYREALQLHQAALIELRELIETPAEATALQEIYTQYGQFLLTAEQQIVATRRGLPGAGRTLVWQSESQTQQKAIIAGLDVLVSQRQRTIDGELSRIRSLTTLIYPMMALAIVAAAAVLTSITWLTRQRLVAIAQ